MRIQAGLWAALAALLLTVAPGVAAAAPGDSRGVGAQHRSARADAALDAARALFVREPRGRLHARRGAVSGSHPENATAVLHDLATSLPALEPSQRRVARAILARPTDDRAESWPNVKYDGAPTGEVCSDQAALCLHWVTDAEHGVADPAHSHAPDLTDTDGDGVPESVEEYLRVLEQVWQRIVVELGYRPPPPDRDGGGTDIYLAELGQFGMYGYCALEDRRTGASYCVLDDDFQGFLSSPSESLRVTAAHEFFHAVQYGYSTTVDTWLMEGTAAWVEDEVYDAINDNLQYLARSALSVPSASLDRVLPLDDYDPRAYHWLYGSWIWWQFLTEHVGQRQPDPAVVRQVWQRLDDSGPNLGVLTAQRRVLREHGTSFRGAFARFGAVNRVARRWYDEGRSYRQFVAGPGERFTLQRRRPGTGWQVTTLDHLSTRHAVIRAGRSLRGRWRVRLDLNLPHRFRGSEATVTLHLRGGGLRFRSVRLDRRGNARIHTRLTGPRVRRVALSLTNASTRMTGCGEHTELGWTCQGISRDDDLTFAFRAHAVR